MNLTPNEMRVLQAIDKSEYGDALCDPVWTFSVSDNSGISGLSFSGVVASLTKKGLVQSSAYEGPVDDCVSMTKLGAETYVKAMDGITKKSFQ